MVHMLSHKADGVIQFRAPSAVQIQLNGNFRFFGVPGNFRDSFHVSLPSLL
jgi:hypothetical protein